MALHTNSSNIFLANSLTFLRSVPRSLMLKQQIMQQKRTGIWSRTSYSQNFQERMLVGANSQGSFSIPIELLDGMTNIRTGPNVANLCSKTRLSRTEPSHCFHHLFYDAYYIHPLYTHSMPIHSRHPRHPGPTHNPDIFSIPCSLVRLLSTPVFQKSIINFQRFISCTCNLYVVHRRLSRRTMCKKDFNVP